MIKVKCLSMLTLPYGTVRCFIKPEPLLDQKKSAVWAWYTIIYRFSSLNKSQLKEALNTYTAMKYLDMMLNIIASHFF